jgi:hypothetical protein
MSDVCTVTLDDLLSDGSMTLIHRGARHWLPCNLLFGHAMQVVVFMRQIDGDVLIAPFAKRAGGLSPSETVEPEGMRDYRPLAPVPNQVRSELRRSSPAPTKGVTG